MKDLKDIILSLINKSNADILLDILLICANKPTNFTSLKSGKFTERELWDAAKEFVSNRHNISELHINYAIEGIKEVFSKANIDLLTFDGIKLPNSYMQVYTEPIYYSQYYYSKERYFQDIIYHICKEHITDSLVFKSPTEREIVYIHINHFLGGKKDIRKIELDVEKFKHYYYDEYGNDMRIGIDVNTIKDTLIRFRLVYFYNGYLWPFWFTQDTEFLKIVEEKIKV